MRFNRLAGLAGLVFTALAIAIIVLSGVQPPPGAAVDDILEYLSRDDALRDANAVISAVSLLPLAVFVAGLLVPFRASDREHNEGWATSILFGAVALNSIVAVHEAAFHGLTYRGGAGLDAGVVLGLWDVVYVTGSAAGFAMAVIALSTAVPVFKHKVWPSWHGWLSILLVALGILALIDTVSPASAGAFSGITFLGFTVVWITATSILLLRGSAEVKTGDQQLVSR